MTRGLPSELSGESRDKFRVNVSRGLPLECTVKIFTNVYHIV